MSIEIINTDTAYRHNRPEDSNTPVLPHVSLALGYSAEKRDKCTIERIRNAMYVVAKLIAGGEQELIPLFQRLEKELEKQKDMEFALERAIDFSERNLKRDT